MKNLLPIRLTLLAVLCSGFFSLNAQTLPVTSNLQLWLDGSDPYGTGALPADGTVMTTWIDKSPGLRHASPVTTGSGFQSPMFYGNQINGGGVIRLNGSGTNGSAFSVPLDIRATTNPDVTLFTVYKQGTRINNQAVWGCDDGGWDRFFFSTWSGTPDDGSVSNGSGLVPTAGAGQFGVVKCLTAVYSKTAGANGSAVYLNGQRVTTFTDNTNFTDAIPAMRIGLDGNDNYFTGDIAEMIVYNRKLTDCEITQVNRYLNIKYNVSFSAVTISAGGSTSFTEGDKVVLSTATTGTSYQWLKDNVSIPGATSNSYTAKATGSYRVAVTNSCIDTSAAIPVNVSIQSSPGNALHFDGVNDYIDAGTSILAPSIRTLECWAKFENLVTAQEIISKSSPGLGIELLVYNNSLAFYCMKGPDGAFIEHAVSNFVTGRWYHLVATWDGATRASMRLYVDGVSVGTRTDFGNVNVDGIADPGPATRLYVGRWNDAARYFSGSIDEVRVWGTTRTEAQIRGSAYDTIARNTAGLLAYMRMDHGVAGGNNTTLNQPMDYSSSNLTLNAINFNLTGATSNYVESYATVVPFATAPTTTTSTGFTANWTTPVTGVVNNYLLDVSTNPNFTSFVPGYNNLNVGLVNSFVVTGLAPATTHYFRVRANKSALNAQGANSYSIGTALDIITLPVSWNSFDVTANGKTALIDWGTASELNSSYFTVEKSQDGINFFAIAKVNAHGTSQLTQRYSYTDYAPHEGVSYYRIRATDNDGKLTYSTTKSINFTKPGGLVKLYPSPANNFIYLDLSSFRNTKGNADIYNIQGQFVLSVKVDGSLTKINTSALLPGMYLLKFNKETPIKFEKQ